MKIILPPDWFDVFPPQRNFTQNTKSKRPMAVIQLQELRRKLIAHCLAIDALVEAHIPQKGDTADTCQLHNIRSKLLELESAVSSLEPSDLVYDPNSDYPDTRRSNARKHKLE